MSLSGHAIISSIRLHVKGHPQVWCDGLVKIFVEDAGDAIATLDTVSKEGQAGGYFDASAFILKIPLLANYTKLHENATLGSELR